MLAFVIQNHSHRAGADLGRELVVVLLVMAPPSQELEPPINPERFTKAIMDALNVAYGETEKRSFVRLNLVALAFTLGSIFALMLAVGAVVIAPIVLSQLGLSGASETLIGLARWPIVLGLVVLGLTMLYRYGPSLSDPQWTWLFPGNVIAALSWLILSALFSWYIGHFGNYDATYGSLGAAIGMMTWMWISMIVVLFGAELNAEIQLKTNAASSTF
jgi:membrane protein